MNKYYLQLCHSGVAHDEDPPGRGSGRYPYGSGDRPHQDKEPSKALKVLGSIVKGTTKVVLLSALSSVGSMAITATAARYLITSSVGQQLITQAINGIMTSSIGQQLISQVSGSVGQQLISNVLGSSIGQQLISQYTGGSGINMINSLFSK